MHTVSVYIRQQSLINSVNNIFEDISTTFYSIIDNRIQLCNLCSHRYSFVFKIRLYFCIHETLGGALAEFVFVFSKLVIFAE